MSSPIKLRKLWLFIGWFLVALVVLLSLMPNPPSIDFSASDKVGHMLAYATLMLWFLQLYPAHRRLYIAAALLSLGIVLELLQGLTAFRSLEYLDAMANTGGIILGWLLGKTPLASVLRNIGNRV